MYSRSGIALKRRLAMFKTKKKVQNSRKIEQCKSDDIANLVSWLASLCFMASVLLDYSIHFTVSLRDLLVLYTVIELFVKVSHNLNAVNCRH